MKDDGTPPTKSSYSVDDLKQMGVKLNGMRGQVSKKKKATKKPTLPAAYRKDAKLLQSLPPEALIQAGLDPEIFQAGEQKNKMSNKKITAGGITYDSLKEYRRHQELILLEKAGKIKDLEIQVKFELTPARPDKKIRASHYIADFVYFDVAKDEKIVEDTKGHRTQKFILKKKMMLERHGILILET